MNIEDLKKDCLIMDIETSSHFHGGKEVDIRSNFETYVMLAQCKWFGAYSYKYNKYYYLNLKKDRHLVYNLLKEHKFLVGFNNEDFDYRILLNNNLVHETDKHLNIDCMTILGKSRFKTNSGYAYKNKGELMEYNFKKNSLKHMAEVMKLDIQKGEIDYKIFQKDEWTKEEELEIIKYLEADIKTNKQMFEKIWDYWKPFTELIYENDIKNLSWIRLSIASLIYKSACYLLDIKPEYGDSGEFEEMGGRVIEPRLEEKEGVWYIDFASLYPHIFCMFNLFAESHNKFTDWHGNDLFQVRGYYDVSKPHKLSIAVQEKLKQRQELKKNDPDNPMIYTLKIWLNGLYGITRSPIFKNVHTPNCGWDCCWLGQQIHEFAEDEMKIFGFETISGDTDGLMVYAIDEKHNNREYIKECLRKIINKILENVPFPVKTFNIDIEEYLYYIMYPFSDQPIVDKEIRIKLKEGEVEGYIHALDEKDKKIIINETNGKIIKKGAKWGTQRKGKKKNYMYIYKEGNKKEIKLVGLPIMKDNATALGIKIYNEVLKEEILQNNNAKFSQEKIHNIISEYLKKPDIMEIISIEYRVKHFSSYKNPNSIYAQISKLYFNEGNGTIKLIKNNKIGEVGKGAKYCRINEALSNKLCIEDLDLEKLHNELNPFIEYSNNKKEEITL